MRDTEQSLDRFVDALQGRAVDGGGFVPGESRSLTPRPDTTAWAILALEAAGRGDGVQETARDWLASQQRSDGRISLTPDQPAAAWPTALAILAWHGSTAHAEARQRALAFLLRFRGLAFPRTPLLGHDTTLVGWPWIEATHSWVEPTALGLMALSLNGHESHARAREARALLADRQLPQGGWNYGNTTAFGQTQRSAPDSTGIALAALAKTVPRKGQPEIEPKLDPERFVASLSYLEREVPRIRSPLSLGWSLLGLSAWRRRPEPAVEWCRECLERQATLGTYDTALLAVVLFAAHAPTGLVGSLAGSKQT